MHIEFNIVLSFKIFDYFLHKKLNRWINKLTNIRQNINLYIGIFMNPNLWNSHTIWQKQWDWRKNSFKYYGTFVLHQNHPIIDGMTIIWLLLGFEWQNKKLSNKKKLSKIYYINAINCWTQIFITLFSVFYSLFRSLLMSWWKCQFLNIKIIVMRIFYFLNKFVLTW